MCLNRSHGTENFVSKKKYSNGACLMPISRVFRSIGAATLKEWLLRNAEWTLHGTCTREDSADHSDQISTDGVT